MKKFITTLILCGIVVCYCPLAFSGESKWEEASLNIVRLLPSTFPKLPPAIVGYLEAGGYTVPQCVCQDSPHNVIAGQFIQGGQRDWVVLASKKAISKILIFPAGSVENVTEISELKDKAGLQAINPDKIGYSFVIGSVDKTFIAERYSRYGGPEPPEIKHEGINVAFVGKGSWVLYHDKGRWLRLTGAD